MKRGPNRATRPRRMRKQHHRRLPLSPCGNPKLLRGCVTIAILWPLIAGAQLLSQSGIDSVRTFTSLEAAMKDPDRVFSLDLSGQKLKELPEEVFLFKNLNALRLGHNRLKELPGRLAELIYLQEFGASRNHFTKFPEVLCKLAHLKRLDLSRNQIDGLPECLGDLSELISLDLWSNELGVFPPELEKLKALRFLDLRVISFSEAEIGRIKELLPWVKIWFSQPCNCGDE